MEDGGISRLERERGGGTSKRRKDVGRNVSGGEHWGLEEGRIMEENIEEEKEEEATKKYGRLNQVG